MKKGSLIGKGKTADVFEWGQSEVIKIFHEPHCALEEAKNAEIIDTLGIRAPKFSGTLEYEGHMCIIYERIHGLSMLRLMEPTKEGVAQTARLMAKLQVELHQTELRLPPNLKNEMVRKIKRTRLLTEPQKTRIVLKLDALPDGCSLCHYDFHPDNILMTPEGPVVIDWMNALVGPPIADVSRTSMLLGTHAVPPEAPAWLTDRSKRAFFHDEYLNEYIKSSGIDRSGLELWKLPTLAVRLDELKGQEQTEIINLLAEFERLENDHEADLI